MKLDISSLSAGQTVYCFNLDETFIRKLTITSATPTVVSRGMQIKGTFVRYEGSREESFDESVFSAFQAFETFEEAVDTLSKKLQDLVSLLGDMKTYKLL